MNSKQQRVVALALTALMVAGTAGLAMAAAPTVDSETTDTASTSELTDGATQTYNDTTNSTLQFQVDSTNATVEVSQNNTTLRTFDTSDMEQTFNDSTNSSYYYNLTVDDDASDYTGIEAGPSENVTLTFQIANDSSMDSPDTTNVTVYFENHANKTFTRFDDADTETSDPGRYASLKANAMSLAGDEVNVTDPAKAKRTVDVNGDNQSAITAHVADPNASDALDETHDDSTDDGGVTFMGVAKVGDSFVPMMAAGEEAPDWVDTNEDAYVVVADGGDEVTVQNAGAVLDSSDSSVDIVVVGNEQANFGQITSMMSDYGASSFETYTTAATQGELVTFSEQFDLEA